MNNNRSKRPLTLVRRACIGKFGAYIWDVTNNLTYFLFGVVDREVEWRALRRDVGAYEEYAILFAWWAWRQKSQRDKNRAEDYAWRGAFPGSSTYFPGKYETGAMWPKNEPRWEAHAAYLRTLRSKR